MSRPRRSRVAAAAFGHVLGRRTLVAYGTVVVLLGLAAGALSFTGWGVDARHEHVLVLPSHADSPMPPWKLATDRLRFGRWVVEVVCPDAEGDAYRAAPGGRAIATCCAVTKSAVWILPRPDLTRGDTGEPVRAEALASLLRKAGEPEAPGGALAAATDVSPEGPVRQTWQGHSVGCEGVTGGPWVRLTPHNDETPARLAQRLSGYYLPVDEAKVRPAGAGVPVGTGPFAVEALWRVSTAEDEPAGDAALASIAARLRLRVNVAQSEPGGEQGRGAMDGPILARTRDLVVLRSRTPDTRAKRVAMVGVQVDQREWREAETGLRASLYGLFDRGLAQVAWGLPDDLLDPVQTLPITVAQAWERRFALKLVPYLAIRGYPTSEGDPAAASQEWWTHIGRRRALERSRQESFALEHGLLPAAGVLPVQFIALEPGPAPASDATTIPGAPCLCLRSTRMWRGPAEDLAEALGAPLAGGVVHDFASEDACKEHPQCLSADVAAWVIEARSPVLELWSLAFKLGWAPSQRAREKLEEALTEDAARRWTRTRPAAAGPPPMSPVEKAARAVDPELVSLGYAPLISFVADGLKGYYPQESQVDPFAFGLDPHVAAWLAWLLTGLFLLGAALAALEIVGGIREDTRHRSLAYLARFARHEAAAPLGAIRDWARALPADGASARPRERILAEAQAASTLLEQSAWVLQNQEALQALVVGQCRLVADVLAPLMEELKRWAESEQVTLEPPQPDVRAWRQGTVSATAWASRAMLYPLLRNALDYRQGDTARIEVVVKRVGKYLRVQVVDEGLGIEDGVDAEDLFRVGYRAGRRGGTASGGYGFGLAVARQLARFAGGDVTLSSRRDPTCFELRLPLR